MGGELPGMQIVEAGGGQDEAPAESSDDQD
jgi:hypothetical protein